MPFPREGEAARLYAHLNDPPPAPSLYAPSLGTALDDVVARAMSKRPEDRYPSAGDLGRAAQAALSGGEVTVPERAVATGAAATRETSSPTEPEPPRGFEPSTEADPPTKATHRLESRPEGRLSGPAGGSRRRLALIGGLLVAAALVVAVIAIAGSGGDDGGDATAQGEDPSAKQEEKPNSQQKPEPKPLTRSRLIEEADAICSTSQARYVEIRDLESEFSADVAYAEELVEIARPRIQGLRQLDPPASVAGPYREYVKEQERVLDTDEAALRAARQGDSAGVEEARDSRDSGDAKRESLAREIGFTVCSTPQ